MSTTRKKRATSRATSTSSSSSSSSEPKDERTRIALRLLRELAERDELPELELAGNVGRVAARYALPAEELPELVAYCCAWRARVERLQ